MISLTVNGMPVAVPEGATLLDAVRRAGVPLPAFCHYPRLPSHAVCRMCLVALQGHSQPLPACVTAAHHNDIVTTDTHDLVAFRKMNAEWLLARHPNDCVHCELDGTCPFQHVVVENHLQARWEYLPRGAIEHPEHRLIDHTSPSIWRDLQKCIECGLCVEACGQPGQQQYVIGFAERGSGRLPVTVFDHALADTACISCGQCTLVCPTGALVEAPHWHEVLRILAAGRRISTVQVAPATRIAISEEFGMAPGTVSTGRLINALRQLGFHYVFDTNFAADLTIMEEGAELLARLSKREQLPLFTSCCPGWINWVEINRPDLVGHLSTTRSPQQMHGAVTKRGNFARSLGPAYATGRDEPYVVSVMPCTAKKDEAMRPGMAGDIDHVLTTRELARMIRARGIAFNALPEDGQFDRPLGESTGAAQMFGASGGVMEALVRNALHVLGEPASLVLEWQQLRGVEEGIKTADIPAIGRVAICNGIATAQALLHTDEWKEHYVAIEVMACVGGCLGGGGEPKSMDPLVLKKRMAAMYAIDQHAVRRRSFENTDVQQLYATELTAPNSANAIASLHTSYAVRHSKRLLLMRFIDCVDRRDGAGAASLLHPDAIWATATAFGSIRGAQDIAAFIHARLPPRMYGPAYRRHRMACAADMDDLTVITPTGERCRFDIEVDEVVQGGARRLLIREIRREICAADGGESPGHP